MIGLISRVRSCLRLKEVYESTKSKLKESVAYRVKAGVAVVCVCSASYYFRQNYYLKAKAVDKFEIILSESEFKRRDPEASLFERYAKIHSDDLTKPLAILSPRRPERVQKILKQLAKGNIGILCTDRISDFETPIDPENDLKQKNHFVVLNPENLKTFKLLEKQKLLKVGVGWRVHELNKVLLEKGFYLPIDPVHNGQTLFSLINEDEGRLCHPVHKFFKNLVGDMLVFLSNGEAQIGTHNVGPGINLKELFFGSNANIGIPTEVDLKVFRIPSNYHSIRIVLDKACSWTQIYTMIQNMHSMKQYRYQSELQVTPTSKSIVIQMDKAQAVSDQHLIEKWQRRLLRGGFLEPSVISHVEVNHEFPQEIFKAAPQKSKFNIDLSFLLQNKDFSKESQKLLLYLKENYAQFSDYELGFDLSNKIINISLNYNENSEDLLRHKEFLSTQALQPVYVVQQEQPLIHPSLQKVGFFKYIQSMWNPQRDPLFNLRKSPPTSASPLIQEDPRKSFAKKLVNHIVNDSGQLIYCSNEEIRKFFKDQDLFLNYGLHGANLQLGLYKFFDKANILNNPIFHSKFHPNP